MYRIENAELKDVDIILDCKLEMIFNSEEIARLEKSDMEKVVNYTEEEIRENIEEYRMAYNQEELIAIYSIVNDYKNGILIDTLYVMPNARANGIASNLIEDLILKNFKPIYVWLYKNNDIGIHLCKKYNFSIEEETEYKYYMKNENIKESNALIKLNMFKEEVKQLAKKYDVNYDLIIN